MAHVKAGGSARMNRDSKPKHLGIKVYSGETVKPGVIIVRQKGTKVHPGVGVKVGCDWTIYSNTVGVVNFFQRLGKKMVSVV